MWKQIVISAVISVISIFSYNLYLKHTGAFSPCIKGIYTVNLTESIQQLRRLYAKDLIEGKIPDTRSLLLRVQHSIDALAKNLPPGYVILPDECVIAGERKKIDLLTGKVIKTNEAQKIAH